MMRWLAGRAAALLLPACGDGWRNRNAGGSNGPGSGQLPRIRISTPDTGASVPEHSKITIEAEVTDPNAVVARVDFYQDNRGIGSAGSPPYTLSYALKKGAHQLCAVAVDFDGVPVASPPVTVFVVKGDGHKDDDKDDKED